MMKFTVGSTVRDRKRKRVGTIEYVFVPFSAKDVVDAVLVQFKGYSSSEWMYIKDLELMNRADNTIYGKILNKMK